MEWLRSYNIFRKADMIEKEGLLFLVIDAVEVPDFDRKGRYLYMLQLTGEATKVNNKIAVGE